MKQTNPEDNKKSRVPLQVRGLPLLDIIIDKGNCSAREVDMTPTPDGESIEAKREYERKAEIAKSICQACDIRVVCGVYCRLNFAPGIHGANTATPEERRQIGAAEVNPDRFIRQAITNHQDTFDKQGR